jgi:hypothetical protein
LYWQLSGGEALHAGAVCLGPRAFAFCATSGTGKSTIAYGLVERGHTVLTDDGVLLDATSRPALVRASARGVRLRRESATHFGLDAVGEALDLPVQTSPPVTPLGGVIVLDRETPGTPLDVAPLAGAAALTAVLAHAHHLDPTDSAMRGRSIRRYLDVLDSTPAWRLRYPSGFDRLPAALDAIERLAEQAT